MNDSSVPTQDKCDALCACIEGEISCVKNDNCVSEEEVPESEIITTLAPDQESEEIPESTIQPEGEDTDIVPDQTEETASEITTDSSIDEFPGDEFEEEDVSTIVPMKEEEEMTSIEEETDVEEDIDSDIPANIYATNTVYCAK